MSGLLVIYTSALSFISGVCYTRNIYIKKEMDEATNRAKAEEIAKK
jgi:hypothetical protein